jgi:hypothetical protein
MHLEARENVTVRWQGGMRYFVRSQSIHTENSHKYTRSTITDMLERSGWPRARVDRSQGMVRPRLRAPGPSLCPESSMMLASRYA